MISAVIPRIRTKFSVLVVSGAVGYSSKLKDGATFKTLSGSTIQISIKNGDVFANGVKVVVPDVLVANGVVHVIDG